jgi:hypothetical protein
MDWIDKAEVEINTGNHNCPDNTSGGGGSNINHVVL